jgi:hypothetical protein
MGFSTVVRAPRAVVPLLVAGCLAGALPAAVPAPPVSAHQAAPGTSAASEQVAALLQGRIPIVTEHRYRIAGKIRPLLFWIGRDNVGGARVRWRRGEGGDRGYDLLIGSDPSRAPRKTNRWGFIMEESVAGTATVLGVMKKGQEETLEEAKSNVSTEAGGGVMFDMIRATVGASESVAYVTSTKVDRDYSYLELVALMERLVRETSPPRVRSVAVPAGGQQGLLMSVAALLKDGVETLRATSKAPLRKTLPYAYYRKQYDLTRVSSGVERRETYGGVTYPRLLKSEFEIRGRGETWVESFTVVCGVDGPLAEIPVFITYQPRWWFKLELVLDERQAF